MRKISAVGLFGCDKFEETPNQKVIDQSKFKIFYFNTAKIEMILRHILTWFFIKLIFNTL